MRGPTKATTAATPKGAGWAVILALVAPVIQAQDVAAQSPVRFRSAPTYESYTLERADSAVSTTVSELSVPVTATIRLGRDGSLVVAGGYARVGVETEEASDEAPLVSGLLDTELRISYRPASGPITLFATAALPTGTSTIGSEELAIPLVITTDVIGFTAPNLGQGGAVAGGAALALPVGRMAVGLAGSFRRSSAYEPIVGSPEFRPGNEIKVRAGLQGPVGRRTFLQLAGIVARRGSDEKGGAPSAGIGNRISGYVALDQGIGRSSLALYAFDLFRAAPTLEAGVTGTGTHPRGNILALGARWSLPLGATTRVAPGFEYRYSSAASAMESEQLERVGSSLRATLVLRQRLSQTVVGVVRAGGLTGSTMIRDVEHDLSGYRLSVHLEVGG